jgi:hypothetical protein
VLYLGETIKGHFSPRTCKNRVHLRATDGRRLRTVRKSLEQELAEEAENESNGKYSTVRLALAITLLPLRPPVKWLFLVAAMPRWVIRLFFVI